MSIVVGDGIVYSETSYSPVIEYGYNKYIVSPTVSTRKVVNVLSDGVVVKSSPLVVPFAYTTVETGLNESYIAQHDMTKWLQYRILDLWLYKDELCSLLKYFIVDEGKVRFVKTQEEYNNNKLCNDTLENIELKSDFIEDKFLSTTNMRHMLIKIIRDYGFKWYDIPSREKVVVRAVKDMLKKEIKDYVRL